MDTYRDVVSWGPAPDVHASALSCAASAVLMLHDSCPLFANDVVVPHYQCHRQSHRHRPDLLPNPV
eukprot:55055-Eustigmatos_ZCMA.PRE.1